MIANNYERFLSRNKDSIYKIEKSKNVGKDPVKCYKAVYSTFKEKNVNIPNYSIWKHFSRFEKEIVGYYIVATMDPEDILYDNKFNPKVTKNPDLIVKPGTYPIVLMKKDLSKEAHLALYDDGDKKEISEKIIKEIIKLNAIPKKSIKCKIYSEDCEVLSSDEVIVKEYIYGSYLDDEDNISDDICHVATLSPKDIVFSFKDYIGDIVGICCDVIIKPGKYKVEKVDDYADLEISRLEKEMEILREKINHSKVETKKLMGEQETYEMDLLRISTDLKNIYSYLKLREDMK